MHHSISLQRYHLHTSHSLHALLQLLLDTQLVCVSTLLLPAVHCARVQTSVAPTHPGNKGQIPPTFSSPWSLLPMSRHYSSRHSALHKRTQHWFLEKSTYFLHIILSWLYLRAKICREGSMMPPRSRMTRCSVESAKEDQNQ